MVKELARALALACAFALLSGCATIVHGTTQRVQIDSIPPGADVAIDDSQHVTTPAAVNLARGRPHNLVFRKAGYQDASENLTSSPSGWIAGNLVAGGVLGMAIDASDGAGRKLSADNVNVTLTPLPPAQSAYQAQAAPLAQPALMRDLQTIVQPQAAHSERVIEPARPEGQPTENFTDDESGYAPPNPRMPVR